MRIGSRAIATALLSATALLVSPAPSSLGATTALASQPATASVCHFTGDAMDSIVASGPRVKEQDWFRTHHVRQRARYQASAQRLIGSTWTTLRSTTQNRSPLLAATTTAMPKLRLTLPASKTYAEYRVLTVIRWIGRSGRVVKTQRLVIREYSMGASCQGRPSGMYHQTISVSATTGSVPTGTTLGGTFTVSGSHGSQNVSIGWYSDSGDCTQGGPYVTWMTVPGDGTYALPGYGAGISGYYSVLVQGGNADTAAGSGCSAPITVYRQVSVQAVSPTENAALNRSLSGPIQEQVVYGTFDRDTYVSYTATLWGPYSTLDAATAANCDGAAHRTVGTGSPIIGVGGATYNLSEPASTMNGGSPAFWRLSVATTVNSNQQFESVPAKVCSAVFHTTN